MVAKGNLSPGQDLRAAIPARLKQDEGYRENVSKKKIEPSPPHTPKKEEERNNLLFLLRDIFSVLEIVDKVSIIKNIKAK